MTFWFHEAYPYQAMSCICHIVFLIPLIFQHEYNPLPQEKVLELARSYFTLGDDYTCLLILPIHFNVFRWVSALFISIKSIVYNFSQYSFKTSVQLSSKISFLTVVIFMFSQNLICVNSICYSKSRIIYIPDEKSLMSV